MILRGSLVKMSAGGKAIMYDANNSSLALLFEQDETAWLEQTASLVAQGRFDAIDHEHLREYLCDMARRDKREVFSRLVLLIAHLLKWEHQPELQFNSWRGTILTQRRDLKHLLESGTLRRYTAEVFEQAYKNAVEQAATETGLSESDFPSVSARSLEEVLAEASKELSGQP